MTELTAADWYDNLTMARACLRKMHAFVHAAERFAPPAPVEGALGDEETLRCLLMEAKEFAEEWADQFDEWSKELEPAAQVALAAPAGGIHE